MSTLTYGSLVQYVASRLAHGESEAQRTAENLERNLGLSAGELLAAAAQGTKGKP